MKHKYDAYQLELWGAEVIPGFIGNHREFFAAEGNNIWNVHPLVMKDMEKRDSLVSRILSIVFGRKRMLLYPRCRKPYKPYEFCLYVALGAPLANRDDAPTEYHGRKVFYQVQI